MPWIGTGHTSEVPGEIDNVPPFDPRSGNHLWIITTAYRWNPGTETPMLDTENLLLIAGPGCFYCEQVYSQYLANRRCTGEPK